MFKFFVCFIGFLQNAIQKFVFMSLASDNYMKNRLTAVRNRYLPLF